MSTADFVTDPRATLVAIGEVVANAATQPQGQAPVLLIAGSFNEYLAFLVASGLPERAVIYVHNLGPLKMYAPGPNTHVVMYGHYWDNPIFAEDTEDAALFYLALHAGGSLGEA